MSMPLNHKSQNLNVLIRNTVESAFKGCYVSEWNLSCFKPDNDAVHDPTTCIFGVVNYLGLLIDLTSHKVFGATQDPAVTANL